MSDDDKKSGDLVPRDDVFKVSILGQGIPSPASDSEDTKDTFSVNYRGEAKIVEPPYNPKTLIRIWENSGALNQNIEAYATNIDGLGHHLEPVFDFDHPEVRKQVQEAMWVKMDAQAGPDDPVPEMPTEEDVNKMLDDLKRRSRMERVRLENFLNSCNPDGSFVSLRRLTRQHEEITGNAYWEVLRNKVQRPARFVLVPPTNLRMTALDDKSTRVVDRMPAGPLGFVEIVQHRFFRRFAQVIGQATVWFKEYGDPRVVSRATGRVYRNMEDFEKAAQKGDQPATEILQFKVPRPGEAYGVPRWIGNLLAVLGSRASDEVNYDYFDNKAIPPLALLVAGGQLGKDAVTRIETYIRDNIKGRQNFHKILIIEAIPTKEQQLAGETAIPKLDFQPLTEVQQGDALFLKYDERNIDKIGSSFRLPRLMRGDVRDFNRATAIASMRFAEEQVFQPEREEFDAVFNRKIMPALGISLWKFRSNTHRTRDPETIAYIAEALVRRGILTPNEGRALASDVLGQTYDPIPEFWAKQPLMLTMAGYRPTREPGATTGGGGLSGDGADDGGIARTGIPQEDPLGGLQGPRSADPSGDVGRDVFQRLRRQTRQRSLVQRAQELAMTHEEAIEALADMLEKNDDDDARRVRRELEDQEDES